MRGSPTSSLLDTVTPRAKHPRAVCLLISLVVVSVLFMICLFFPEAVEHLHCNMGNTARCIYKGSSVLRKLKSFDHQRAKQSCTAKDRHGKVVLVTGSAGFIGFSSSMQLLERGDGIIGIDNFNSYYPVSLKKARVAALEAVGGYTVQGDLNDETLLQQIFELCRPTHVLHLAAQAGVRFAAIDPLSYIDSNMRGTTVLFEAVKAQAPQPLVVYASSSSVYGRNDVVPFSEDDRVDRPASLYAATKRGCELLASTYHSIAGMSVTGLRFFTVYGPWGRPDMAALAFAHSIAEGHPIRIFKGPNDTELARDFTYIDDIVEGILGALDSAAPGVERLFNLGNTHPHTVSEFVTLLEAALAKPAVRNYVALPALGDVLQTHSNISHAAAAFGYTPRISLEEGLQRFAAWFYDYYGPDGQSLRLDEARYVPYRRRA